MFHVTNHHATTLPGRKPLLRGFLLAVAVCALTLSFGESTALAAQSAARTYTFTPVNYPGALSTIVWGINSHGDMVGTYENPANYFHGFVYRKGKFHSIDGPGAAFTQIRGINDDGDIVGTFIPLSDIFAQTPGGGFSGLLQDHNGPLIVLKVPGHINTIFHNITNTGRIYGCYHDEGIDDSPQDSMHGITGRLNRWPTLQLMAEGTTMNVGGDSAGEDFAGQWYDHSPGMLRHRSYVIRNGKRTNFDVPGSNSTIAWGTNNSGEVVGVWGDSVGHPDKELVDEGLWHGFVRDAKGNFTALNYPSSIDTKTLGINNNGDVVGSYTDAAGKMHGYVAKRSGRAELLSPGHGIFLPVTLGEFMDDLDTSASVTATMPAIDSDKPLQTPAQVAACHQTPKIR